jgi:hypothetical protein
VFSLAAVPAGKDLIRFVERWKRELPAALNRLTPHIVTDAAYGNDVLTMRDELEQTAARLDLQWSFSLVHAVALSPRKAELHRVEPDKTGTPVCLDCLTAPADSESLFIRISSADDSDVSILLIPPGLHLETRNTYLIGPMLESIRSRERNLKEVRPSDLRGVFLRQDRDEYLIIGTI